ncbi:MAG: hypothetical protein CFE31_19460 [Rhizobiales bacterium PAR1]|nr:MAG: hypothetical protein CFE31_19460 [Rhizobiales bacterium PAR1]
MKLFPGSAPSSSISFLRIATIVAGVVIFAGAGTLLVRAGDGPDMIKVLRDYNRAQRAPVEVQPMAPLPQIFQPRAQPKLMHVLSYAPRSEPFAPVPRALPAPPQPPEHGLSNVQPKASNGYFPKQARHQPSQTTDGAGLSVATNYCVRLCDGFAFPIGHASGSFGVQEAACRSACPGADTALYSAPAGAKDFDSLTRNGSPYSALPAAFRYREKITNACTCRPIGATQSASTILRDITLKAGDLVMTRAGARHFDGARQFPYRPTAFSEAIAKLTVKREVDVVRAMEVASVRGILSGTASADLRNRVVMDIRQAERSAIRVLPAIENTRGMPRGFVELRAREKTVPVVLHGVKRPAGLVALN